MELGGTVVHTTNFRLPKTNGDSALNMRQQTSISHDDSPTKLRFALHPFAHRLRDDFHAFRYTGMLFKPLTSQSMQSLGRR
jgi:hypothetical protein